MKRFAARTLVLGVLSATTLLMGAQAVLAASPHFTKGGAPRCTDIGTQLVCTGELAGLGNQDLVIDVQSTALVQVNCVNPGGNEAPGQNKVTRAVSGTQTIPGSAIKNGRAKFRVVTTAPTAPSAEEAGCPNGNWTTRVVGVTFSNVTVTISQGGQVLFTCTAASVPENGSVLLNC
ncbi:MAG TPA: hypothetical protein VF660_10860 [Actinomycetota bacterium]